MARSARELFEEAMRPDPAERATLLRLLIDTLDATSEAGVEDAWRVEIERRIAELDSGAVASPAERVEAWVLTGVSQFYLGADSGAVHAFREAFALDPSAQAQLPDPDLQRMFDGLRPVPSAAPMATGPARLPEDMIYNCLPKCPEGVQPPKLVLGSEGLGMLRVKVRAGEMPRTPTLVAIRAVVDSMGFVEPGSIELPPSGLPADFTEPFIEELRHRRYTPARLGDRPVRARIEVRIKVRGLP